VFRRDAPRGYNADDVGGGAASLGAPLDGSVLQGLPTVFSSLIGVRFLEVANMITSSLNVLDSYARAFRDLINAKVWSSSKTIRELLRLNQEIGDSENSDWGNSERTR
jgi:hypothetical protein